MIDLRVVFSICITLFVIHVMSTHYELIFSLYRYEDLNDSLYGFQVPFTVLYSIYFQQFFNFMKFDMFFFYFYLLFLHKFNLDSSPPPQTHTQTLEINSGNAHIILTENIILYSIYILPF